MSRFSGLDPASLETLAEATARLEASFGSLPPDTETTPAESMRAIINRVADRLGDNFPYFHPLYAGQMLKPPHPVARLAYALAQTLNPNNHALDGGRASSAMEKEAVSALASMFGWKAFLGHLTGGGTMANLEALWVARELKPGAVVASSPSHYTHHRLAGVLGMPFISVPCDRKARMDLNALDHILEREEVSVVVATAGTTGEGVVDPISDMIALKPNRGFRLHVDAAYGGFFVLAENLRPETRVNLDTVTQADSIVIDPHKHGLQPYGCGCVLFRDRNVGTVYKHESPYTYFTSDDLHLGEISLECSRPGAAAVALWATQRLLPYTAGGEFAESLEACHRTALALHAWLEAQESFVPILEPELDIVVWGINAPRAGLASAQAKRLFDIAATHNLHLALASFPKTLLQRRFPEMDWDTDSMTCLRSCLMKPAHEAWLDRITVLLRQSWEELKAERLGSG